MRIAAILLLASLSLFSCKRENGIDPVFVKTWGLYELADTTFSIPDGYYMCSWMAREMPAVTGAATIFQAPTVPALKMVLSNSPGSPLPCSGATMANWKRVL